MLEFGKTRLAMYEKRKAFLLARLQRECEVLSAKARFVKLVLSGELVIKRRKILDLCKELRQRSFKPIHEMKGHGTPTDKETKEGESDDDGGRAEMMLATRTPTLMKVRKTRAAGLRRPVAVR